jgi:hypothetical protein
MRPKLPIILAAVSWLVVAACGPIAPTTSAPPVGSPVANKRPLQAAFDENLAKWQAAGITRYAFTFRPECFCDTAPRLVVVDADGVRVDGVPIGGATFAPAGVPGLFEQARRAIEGDSAAIEYDFATGVPIHLVSDPVQNAVDDELTFSVTEWTLDPPDDRALGRITTARRQWDQQRLAAYTLTISFVCSCVHDGKTYDIAVGDGEPVVRSGGRKVNFNHLEGVPLSVEAAFEFAASYASTGDGVVAIDPESGVPTHIRVDSAKDSSGRPETLDVTVRVP